MERADQMLQGIGGTLTRVEWLAYRKIVSSRRGRSYSVAARDEIAVAALCSVGYVTCIYARLAELGLIWRAKVAGEWRSYISYFEPAPGAAPAPVEVAPVAAPVELEQSPAGQRAAVVWGLLALLQSTAQICADPAAPSIASPCIDTTGGGFFSPPGVDPKSASSRSVDRLLRGKDSVKDSSVGAHAPPGPVAAADRPAARGRASASRGAIPVTPTVARLRAFGVRSPLVLLKHAGRDLAEVERLILAIDHWPEPVNDPPALLVALLDDPVGVWPSRVSMIERALGAVRRVNFCLGCRESVPDLWRHEACPRCGASRSLAVVEASAPVALELVAPPVCAVCAVAPVGRWGALCAACAPPVELALDRASAALLAARWGAGVADPAPLPAWLAAAGGAP
jgi:hypothetical protein